MKEINWSKLLKVLIAVLTAIAGSIGVVSCAAKRETHPTSSQARLLGADKPAAVASDANAPRRPCEGGSTVIAENVIPCHYENALPLRDV